MRAFFWTLNLVVCAGLGVMSDAQAQTPAQEWVAVGRLEFAGAPICTATLVTENHVLTAAHCLFDPETATALPRERLVFRAGWRNAHGAAFRGVRSVALHPAYSYADPTGSERVRHDLALLTLIRPIRANQVVPLRAARAPAVGDQVSIVTRSSAGPETVARPSPCAVRAVEDGVLVLGCEVTFGMSGAPILVPTQDGPRVVGVVSAKARADGAEVALGTGLETLLTVPQHP